MLPLGGGGGGVGGLGSSGAGASAASPDVIQIFALSLAEYMSSVKYNQVLYLITLGNQKLYTFIKL